MAGASIPEPAPSNTPDRHPFAKIARPAPEGDTPPAERARGRHGERSAAAGMLRLVVALTASVCAWLLGSAVTLSMADGPVGAARRGNDALYRTRGPIYSLAAAPRLGVLLAGGARVIQPVGFGAGLQFRVHALHLGPVRIGGEVQLGHTRFLERRTILHDSGAGPEEVRRYAALGHTDFTLGPSFQVVMGPVFLELGGGAGLGISSFVRPTGAFSNTEEHFVDYTALLRGGGHLGIPIRNNQGLLVGAALHKYFSKLQIASDPGEVDADPEVSDVNPFDLMLDFTLGYHCMF